MMMSWNETGIRPQWEVLCSAAEPAATQPWWSELDRLLSVRNVTLRAADSERDALERVEAGGVDLAVLCADAAGGGGLRTLEMIRSRTVSLPCLLVTPEASAAVLRRALALRAYSVIPQPVDALLLADLLVRVLQKRISR